MKNSSAKKRFTKARSREFKPPSLDFIFDSVVIAPPLEEFLFRGGLQGDTPEAGEKDIFGDTAIARILSVNFLFAHMHKGFRLDLHAYPLFGILRHTTGSLTAPIAAHFTNNLLKTSAFFLLNSAASKILSKNGNYSSL